MTQGRRVELSAKQRTDLWRRWKAGQSLHEIGRALITENPVDKVVGIVKRHSELCELGAESRALREAGVYRQILDAADGSPPFRADEAELRPYSGLRLRSRPRLAPLKSLGEFN